MNVELLPDLKLYNYSSITYILFSMDLFLTTLTCYLYFTIPYKITRTEESYLNNKLLINTDSENELNYLEGTLKTCITYK